MRNLGIYSIISIALAPPAAEYSLRPKSQGSNETWLNWYLLRRRKINCLDMGSTLILHYGKKIFLRGTVGSKNCDDKQNSHIFLHSPPYVVVLIKPLLDVKANGK